MDRLRRIIWPRGQAWRGGLIVGAVVVALVVAFALLNVSLSGAGRFKDIAAIVQSSVTAVAIVAGGIFAYYKLQLFRDLDPHLTISHEVSHRFIGDNYVHIAVTANLHNSSRVSVEVRRFTFRLQEISPVSDSEIERLYKEMFEDRIEDYLQWPILEEIELDKEKNVMVIEPGETYYETNEFIISTGIKTVMVYTYFDNSTPSRKSQSAEGWDATTIYDIVDDD